MVIPRVLYVIIASLSTFWDRILDVIVPNPASKLASKAVMIPMSKLIAPGWRIHKVPK